MQNNLIVFDIDGTLTQTNHVDASSFTRAVLEVLSISAIDTDWYNFKYSTDIGILTEIIQAKFKRDPLFEEIESIRNKFLFYLNENFRDERFQCVPIHGALHVFDKMFALGWDVGIATGGWQKSALLKLNMAKIPFQNIPIAHSDDHIEREQIISIAVDRAKTYYQKQDYSKIIYVGDRFWDKKAAENLNIGFIGIGSEFESIANINHIHDYNDLRLEKYLTSR